MAWSYSAGSATVPTIAGLCEFSNLRLNDGSFKSLVVPPLISSAPLRFATSPLPGDGGYVAPRFLAEWAFEIDGYFLVADHTEIQPATDYLLSKVNTQQGWMTLLLRGIGWSANRQMTVAVAGQVAVTEPEVQQKKVPTRIITIPVIAADPRMYEASASAVTVTTSTNLVNAGTTRTPIVVRFNGPQTNPRIDLDSSPSGANRISVAAVIAGGDFIEVNTYDSTTGTLTAVNAAGANSLALLDATTAKTLAPGTSAWTRTHSAGSGSTVVTTRGAWA